VLNVESDQQGRYTADDEETLVIVAGSPPPSSPTRDWSKM
jgi:hypothetical protein